MKEYKDIIDPVNGFSKVRNKQNLWGFVNEKDEEIVPCKYIYVIDFFNNHAMVRNTLNLWGFVNEQGIEFVPCIYKHISDFYNGFAYAQSNENNLWGFVNKQGIEKVPCKYLDVCYFEYGFARVQTIEQKWIFVNESGTELTQKQFLSANCIKEDSNFYYFKKILTKDNKSPNYKFNYEFDKQYKFKVNTDLKKECGEGFNVATESYLKTFYDPSIHNIHIAKIPKYSTIIIPTDLQKIRSNIGILTNEKT